MVALLAGTDLHELSGRHLGRETVRKRVGRMIFFKGESFKQINPGFP